MLQCCVHGACAHVCVWSARAHAHTHTYAGVTNVTVRVDISCNSMRVYTLNIFPGAAHATREAHGPKRHISRVVYQRDCARFMAASCARACVYARADCAHASSAAAVALYRIKSGRARCRCGAATSHADSDTQTSQRHTTRGSEIGVGDCGRATAWNIK